MISIIIPAYNEELSLENTIKEIKTTLKDNKKYKDYEIIVVNDGSTDSTRTIALKNNVKLIDNLENMGYGYSIKKGIDASKYETIIIIDGDNTYPFNEVFKLLSKKEQGYDLVVGARTGKYYKESIIKMILRRILKFIVEYISGKKIKDINSGFRVFDKSTVKKYYNKLCNTFSFTTTQTLSYAMNYLTICYVDISYRKRKDKSKIKIIRDSLISLRYILSSCIYYNPLKIFNLLSLICIIFSIIGFICSHFLHINAGYILGIGGLLLSIVVFSFGLLAVLLKQIMDK